MAAAAAFAVLAMAGLPAAAAHGSLGASGEIARTWGTNGRVLAVLDVGGPVIIGGDFTSVIDPNGREFPAAHVAKYDPLTGAFDTSWALSTNGSVAALAADGDRLFVGGDYTQVNGVARKMLVAVSVTTGALDTTFQAKPNRAVEAVAVSAGKVYFGGQFTNVADSSGTKALSYLARADETSGVVDTAWRSGITLDARVRSLLPAPVGDKVYVGGDFTLVNGQSFASKLTAVTTSSPGGIDPVFRAGYTNLTTRAVAFALATDGANLLIGAGGSGGACTMQNATTGATIWSKHGTGNVVGVAFFGSYSYCGGHFSGAGSFAGQERNKLAAVETSTGVLTPYAPLVNSALGVWSMGSNSDSLFIGGDFTKVNNTTQPGFGMFKDLSAVAVPATPGNLTSDSGDASVLLAWDIPSTDGGTTISSYRVYRGEDADPLTLLASTDQASYADLTAVNGHHYMYAVAARNAVGDGPMSAPASGDPLSNTVIPPSAPTSFRAVGAVGHSSLSWGLPASDGGSSVTGYRVYRGLAAGLESPLADLPATALGYTDSDVTVGTRYYYQVSALNASGEGPRGTEESATPNTGVPNQPTLTLVASTPDVALSWQVTNEGGSPITKYILTRNAIRIAVLSPTQTTYTDAAAPHNVTLEYQVRAVNSYGTSKGSNKVIVILP